MQNTQCVREWESEREMEKSEKMRKRNGKEWENDRDGKSEKMRERDGKWC
jgi:hypothetical protein